MKDIRFKKATKSKVGQKYCTLSHCIIKTQRENLKVAIVEVKLALKRAS